MSRLLVIILLLAAAAAVYIIRRRRGGSLLGYSQQAFLIRRILWLAALVTVSLGLIYFAVGGLLGSGIFAPRSADGILKSAKGPSSYVWSAEAVHRYSAAGKVVREDSRRTVAIDLTDNSYQILLQNVLPDNAQFESDGHVAIRNTQSRQSQGQPWQQLNNICRGQQPPAADLLVMPSGQELAAAKPHLADSNTNIGGSKAWLLNFTPTPVVIERLLLVPFLSTNAVSSNERRWALAGAEKQLIDQQRYTVSNAQVWVTKSSPRTIYQIAVSIKLADGRRWDLLGSIRPQPGQSTKLTLKIPSRSCG